MQTFFSFTVDTCNPSSAPVVAGVGTDHRLLQPTLTRSHCVNNEEYEADFDATPRRVSWDDVWAEMEELLGNPDEFAPATLLAHRTAFAHLRASAAEPAAVNRSSISKLIHRLVHEPGRRGKIGVKRRYRTIISVLSTVRTQVNHLLEEGYLARDPFTKRNRKQFARRLRPEEPIKRSHSLADLLAVLGQADREYEKLQEKAPPLESGGFKRYQLARNPFYRAGRLRALLYTVAYTGIRAAEALHLRRDEIDFKNHILWVTERSHRTKTAASRNFVPMPRAMERVLWDWLEVSPGDFAFRCTTKDSPWLHGSPRYRPSDQLGLLGMRAGVPGVCLLSLRHTFATHCEQLWGLSREQIARLLRHTNVQTQQHYLERDRDNLVALVFDRDFRQQPLRVAATG